MIEDSDSGWAERTVVVTGGGSGIGRAVAVDLAEHGADVLVVGRRAAALTATASHHPGIRAHVADVGRPEDVTTIIEAALTERGRLDVLVNNAGTGRPAALGDITPDDATTMWTTNVLGPVLLTQAALPHLRAGGGSIVNVSSTFGAKPAPGISVYGATKAAVEQLTRSWALELAGLGVRVNAVAPGPTESEALAAMGLSSDEIARLEADERARIPLGRRGRPEDVAPWIRALADPTSWVTGQVVGVDGGYAVA
ncbi:SDR family NAD(P)-dependent oxidoreductase [Pseudonocardia kunmingensis]|uniref:Short-subunit dehydrogenase n=1 Tax=Pseudonocardia kunmingensis TaxID=630975 RepID=A0A543DII3_9PSEU|nr:SDR family oxidoreductase [Pseudonocardia kunmingensis]TQM09075.1 short-subunit dehydrogenase [Pseudonocardia kunmingensis]